MSHSNVLSPVASRDAALEISVFRLHMLRICYLILAVGLGLVMWPSVLNHTNEFATRAGIQVSLLASLGAMAALGLRFPVRMLPLLLFELTWKTIYLVAFALPLWLAHQVTPKAAEDIAACLMVVIFIPLIPWHYVFATYLATTGERWR